MTLTIIDTFCCLAKVPGKKAVRDALSGAKDGEQNGTHKESARKQRTRKAKITHKLLATVAIPQALRWCDCDCDGRDSFVE
ncbi:hypothetical protein Y032_0027g1505 [Ancylostoma ceylanicum]|uniref:Uncharacterized protein n=1 Tax=Ancylostoma ceylanicum TaxID=53326 RepID=A0A016UT90_9BILA|nr:hypothetical protein Y032_0027g1505 [Ancylostoma ceylanicum]